MNLHDLPQPDDELRRVASWLRHAFAAHVGPAWEVRRNPTNMRYPWQYRMGPNDDWRPAEQLDYDRWLRDTRAWEARAER